MSTFVHFNITAKDPSLLKTFYENLFGWETAYLPGNESYYMVTTHNADGSPGLRGDIAKRSSRETPGIVSFIGVKSIDEMLLKVVKAGGRILQPKQPIPGFGYAAVCTDPDKNTFGLFEEDKDAAW